MRPKLKRTDEALRVLERPSFKKKKQLPKSARMQAVMMRPSLKSLLIDSRKKREVSVRVMRRLKNETS